MARMILGILYGEPQDGARSLVEKLPMIAGSLGLGAFVLLLGLYIPAPLRALLAEAARGLGGGAP